MNSRNVFEKFVIDQLIHSKFGDPINEDQKKYNIYIERLCNRILCGNELENMFILATPVQCRDCEYYILNPEILNINLPRDERYICKSETCPKGYLRKND